MYTYVQLEADRAVMRDGSAGASMPLHRAWCRSLKPHTGTPCLLSGEPGQKAVFITGDYNFIIIDRI